ncbi:LYR motif-containing protein 4-like [Homarus americanus]|uniref:LYR motif-containing protein 4-like n=1 Tax=Homarus americanus TaxID=6706 RepID=A0A8J5MQP2_HOMAM|nr:LYR motif-containing protein 4-like [Homarus americanus]KAG7160191.1 LYR motif-containing protein 4-like [Homarus americanus]
MAAGGGRQALALYKSLLRESQKFLAYNYREYALRRIRDGFKATRNVTEEATLQRELQHARESLEVIKRQVALGQLYRPPNLIIEKK